MPDMKLFPTTQRPALSALYVPKLDDAASHPALQQHNHPDQGFPQTVLLCREDELR